MAKIEAMDRATHSTVMREKTMGLGTKGIKKSTRRVTGLQVLSVPNRAMRNVRVVFFNDPNADSAETGQCHYLITVWDAESNEETVHKSERTYLSITDLKPGRSYLLYVEAEVDGLRGGKTFHDGMIQTYHDDGSTAGVSAEDDSGVGTSIPSSSGLGQSIQDDQEKQAGTTEDGESMKGVSAEDDSSVRTFLTPLPSVEQSIQNDQEKEAGTTEDGESMKGTVDLKNTDIPSHLQRIWGKDRAKILEDDVLQMCIENGVEKFADINYLRNGVAFQKVKSLKAVDVGKFKAYLQDLYGDLQWNSKETRQGWKHKQIAIKAHRFAFDEDFLCALNQTDADIVIDAHELVQV